MEAIKNASFEGKSSFSLPQGAEIVKKNFNIRVEEIENGFIICKSYDIEYQTIEGKKDYAYYNKRFYSKTNPITLNIEEKEVPLEDKLD